MDLKDLVSAASAARESMRALDTSVIVRNELTAQQHAAWADLATTGRALADARESCRSLVGNMDLAALASGGGNALALDAARSTALTVREALSDERRRLIAPPLADMTGLRDTLAVINEHLQGAATAARSIESALLSADAWRTLGLAQEGLQEGYVRRRTDRTPRRPAKLDAIAPAAPETPCEVASSTHAPAPATALDLDRIFVVWQLVLFEHRELAARFDPMARVDRLAPSDHMLIIAAHAGDHARTYAALAHTFLQQVQIAAAPAGPTTRASEALSAEDAERLIATANELTAMLRTIEAARSPTGR